MNPRFSKGPLSRAVAARNRGRHVERQGDSQYGEINVGELERQVSMWGGTALALYGLLKGRLSGLTLAAIGGALIYRGHTGHCHLYEAMGHSTADSSTETRHIDERDEAERHAAHQERHNQAAG